MITQVYKKDTLSGPFFRYLSLCMNCEEEHEWAVTEWLHDTPDTARTYYHRTLIDAMWDIEWWHKSNETHMYHLIEDTWKDGLKEQYKKELQQEIEWMNSNLYHSLYIDDSNEIIERIKDEINNLQYRLDNLKER